MSSDSSTARLARLEEQHHRHLRWAGYWALSPLVAFIAATAFGRIPWPNVEAGGRAQLDYGLRNHAAEWQSVLWYVVVTGGVGMFLILIAVIYMRRAGHPTMPGITMVTFAGLWMALEGASCAAFLPFGLMGRGYPDFGRTQSQLDVIAGMWDLSQVLATFGCMALGPALIALFIANRADPVLPVTLTNWGASTGAALALGFNICSSLFITTGPLAPASFATAVLSYASVLLWMTAVGAVLLNRTRTR
ncbi:hypothetical protein ABZ502_16755 [Streptomyces abikoensis]|uniref:hypothetical protein n=1 Tax=Streptomyces abikoensis TaxID=97398 RepID=UPI0033FF7779